MTEKVPLVGIALALILLGFFVIFVATLMSQPYFPATNKTGFFVFPFGFGVISGASGWFAFALTLAFLVIFFVFAILFTLGSFRFARSTVEYDRAVEELRLRYARGEITKEQFEQMLKDLKEHRYG